ncbi:MAG: hypothetical protein AAGE98_03060 [Actinomycetota bacterium]
MADRCWRCATELDPADTYCRSCGVRVRAESPDLDVITEVAEPPAPPVEAAAESRRGILTVGALFVVVVVGFFWLTAPDEDDEPTADPFADRADFEATDDVVANDGVRTASTPRLSFGDLAGPIEWETTRAEADGIPLAMFEIDGALFTFDLQLGSSAYWQDFGGEVTVAERTSGGLWLEHGRLGEPGAQISAVAPTADGAIATGLDAGGAPIVWRSSDGVEWTPEPLPATSLGGVAPHRPRSLIERDGVVIVAGAAPQAWQLVGEALSADHADLLELAGGNWQWNGDTITIQGPFGFALHETSADELGVDVEQPGSVGSRQPAPVWVFDDGAWTSNVLGGEVTSFSVRDGDSSIYVTTTSNTGIDINIYRDGQWGASNGSAIGWQLHHGAGSFLSLGERVLNVLDDRFQVDTEVPVPGGSSAHVNGLSAGPSGAALTLMAWGSTAEEARPTSGLLLIDGDHQLAVSDDAIWLELTRAGQVVERMTVGGPDADDYRFESSGDEPRIVLLSSDDGSDVASFTIDELRTLERSGQPFEPPLATPALGALYSPDPATTWYGGQLDDVIDVSPGFNTQLQLLDDHIVLAVIAASDPFGFAPPEFTFTLLEAPIPGQ